MYKARAAGSFAVDFADCLGTPPVALEVSVLTTPGSVQPVPLSPVTIGGVVRNENACFIRGDVDGNGRTSINDPISILYCLFGGLELSCLDAADVDDDGLITITDPIHLLGYLFRHGPEPAQPFPACGGDPPGDVLTCESCPRCAGCP